MTRYELFGTCRAVIGGLILASAATADELAPTQVESWITKRVVMLLETESLVKPVYDEDRSRLTFDLFLSRVDPGKAFFLQADIDRLAEHRTRLGDAIRGGDVAFAFQAFNSFLERVNERLETIRLLLDESPDFTVDEMFIVDARSRQFPRDAAAAREHWRRRIKLELLLLKTESVEGQAARDLLLRRYREFAKRIRATDRDELLTLYLTAFLNSFDPHARLYSRQHFLFSLIRLRLASLGLGLRTEDEGIVVSHIVHDGAAELDGRLQIGDRVWAVAEGEHPRVDLIAGRMDDAFQLLRGSEASLVTLWVQPVGSWEVRKYTLQRKHGKLKGSAPRGRLLTFRSEENGTDHKIGWLELPEFYVMLEGTPEVTRTSHQDVQEVLAKWKKDALDAVVLDLRRNAGWALTEAINVAGLFVDQGPMAQIQSMEGLQIYKDNEPGDSWAGPLVVVTSKLTSPSGELFAGALQDYRRALLVGEGTCGRGSFQAFLSLDDRTENLGGMTVTTQRMFLPSGKSLHRGVIPDVALPSLSTRAVIVDSDRSYFRPPDDLMPIEFPRIARVYDELVTKLRQQSQSRRDASADFARVQRQIERFQFHRKQTSISLQAERFFRKPAGEERPAKPEFYENEVLAIAADYVTGLRESR